MRCRFCGSTLIHSAHEHKNFSAGKAFAGTIVFGPMGAGAGMRGKDIEGFHCTQCGAFMERPMDTTTEKMVNDAVYNAKKGTSYISYNFYKGQYPNIETVQAVENNNTERVSLHLSENPNTVTAINAEEDTMKVKRAFKTNLWDPSCPVYIRNTIIKTGVNGDALSFDIINQSDKTIRSIYLQALVLDDTGDEITTIQCVYQGDNVEPGNTFSLDKAFTVGSDLAYKVEVTCEKAAFTDDSVWRAENGTKAYAVELSETTEFPRFKYLFREYDRILEEKGVVRRNNRGRYIKTWRPEYLPIKNEGDGYWTCTCGMPVRINSTCPVCKCSYEELQKIFSQEYLAKKQHDAVFQRASERAAETVSYREKLDKEIEEKKASEYEKALSAKGSKSIAQLTDAVDLLDNLGNYKDAKKLNAEYRTCIEELKTEEEKKRQEEKERREKELQEEEVRRKKEREEKEAAEEIIKKRNRKIGVIVAFVAAIGIALYFIITGVVIPNNKYSSAISLMDSGKYEEAIELFENLGGFKDSENKIRECQDGILMDEYNAAVALMNSQNYEAAIEAFQKLDAYKDSVQKTEECKDAIQMQDYETNVSLMDRGDYEKAIIGFEKIRDYKDSEEKIELCLERLAEATYASANSLINEGKYRKAVGLLTEILEYKDSQELIEDCKRKFIYDSATNDILEYGFYQGETITWRVLDDTDDILTLITEKAVDGKPYNETREVVSWSTCSLRRWLNNSWINEAFSSEERSLVTLDGSPVSDKVYLLSVDEAEKYFSSNSDRICGCSPYAIEQGIESKALPGRCTWWLRDDRPSDEKIEDFVDADGSIHTNAWIDSGTEESHRPMIGVRPVVRIKVK